MINLSKISIIAVAILATTYAITLLNKNEVKPQVMSTNNINNTISAPVSLKEDIQEAQQAHSEALAEPVRNNRAAPPPPLTANKSSATSLKDSPQNKAFGHGHEDHATVDHNQPPPPAGARI